MSIEYSDGLVLVPLDELPHMEGYCGNRASLIGKALKVKREPNNMEGCSWYGNSPQWSIGKDGEYSDVSSTRIPVNKTTHRIRFENETESLVTIVIEPREGV